MSYWSYVNGIVKVRPLGRTQAETRYILETVLDHLPRVTGSESDMSVHIVQSEGYNYSSTHTEFGHYGGYYDRKTLSTKQQLDYILTVEGSLRDRMFDQTYREVQKWLCRLAKRVRIENVLIEVDGYKKSTIITSHRNDPKWPGKSVYWDMFEYPSWSDKNEDGEPNWCEYLMWEGTRGMQYPMMLMYKYYNDPRNDVEVERRREYCESR